jgi:hypothetical protein
MGWTTAERGAERNAMRRSESQRGEGRAGAIFALALCLVAVFLAVKIVPVRVNAYEFKETLREEAKYISVHRNNAQGLERLLQAAESLEIPVSAKNIKIRRTKAEVIVSATYELPIDLKVTTYMFKFDEEMRAPLF